MWKYFDTFEVFSAGHEPTQSVKLHTHTHVANMLAFALTALALAAPYNAPDASGSVHLSGSVTAPGPADKEPSFEDFKVRFYPVPLLDHFPHIHQPFH